MSDYKVPCGRTTGHGESCVGGCLCAGCSEIERLRAEIKRKDRALLSAKYDAERVEYYKNILCVDNGKWVCLPRTGAAASAIDPEKLGNVLEEIERLREQLRLANIDACISHTDNPGRIVLTPEQINAAWEMGKANGPEGLWSLEELGIVACDRCEGNNVWSITSGVPCPSCKKRGSNGWMIDNKSQSNDNKSEE